MLLPDGSGFSLCAEVRKTRRVPILFLTCCDEEMDTVRGLDCGGDDYVAKPFRLRELLSRIRVLLRRSDAASPERLQIGELILDSARRTVSRGGEVLALTPTEFHILYRLATGRGGYSPAGSCWMPCGISTANSLRTIPCRCICPVCGTS